MTPGMVGVVLAAVVAAGALASVKLVLVGLVAVGILAAVFWSPAVAAYLVIAITPLVAGIDRGLVIPVLRPNEALTLLVASGLVLRRVPRWAIDGFPSIRLGRTEVSLILMCLASSLLPLLWLGLRNRTPTQDDILYSLTLWKYAGLFLVIRASVRTEGEVRRCLALGMMAAGVVAVIAILQSLQLFGVPHLLATYYTHFGNTRALSINRGSSLLSLPIAVADLMVFNIAVAWAWIRRAPSRPRMVTAAFALFVFGALASGQVSAAIALLLCAFAIVLVAGTAKPLIKAIPVAFAAALALWPVIDRRLKGFSNPEGLPESWVGRLHNLRTYFFPELFSHFHYLLGVRPSARVLISQRRGYVWIESGYTWLLWAGGIPFLASFLYFVWVNGRATFAAARARMDSLGIAATGSYVSMVIIGVLMLLDPHLSYRGSGDMLFVLLALATARIPPKAGAESAATNAAAGGGQPVPVHL